MKGKKGGSDTVPAAEEKVIEPKQEHKNIYEALAAFQAENPTIARSKEFGKEGDKMHWWYAPLDEVLKTVRPLTAKHGLAFTWERGGTANDLVCALYHETYARESGKLVEKYSADSKLSEVIYGDVETGVIRSMAIEVKRKGDMKDIGSDSTYARRTTLAEVLGIAPDEDTDGGFEEARRDQVENAMFVRVQKTINEAKTATELDANEKVLRQNLGDIKSGKVPQLGLAEAQLTTLLKLVDDRRAKVSKPGTGAPGDNKDAGGTAEIKVEGETTGKVPLL